MKQFARQQGLEAPNWEFASPDAAALEQLTRDFGFSYMATPKGFDHILQVTIVDAQGKVYRQVYGESFEAPLFIGPLKDLLTASPQPAGDLGALLERVRLLCTVYDPAAGKYRLNYVVLIEILVGLSVLVVGTGSLVLEWRRQRRPRRA